MFICWLVKETKIWCLQNHKSLELNIIKLGKYVWKEINNCILELLNICGLILIENGFMLGSLNRYMLHAFLLLFYSDEDSKTKNLFQCIWLGD